MPGLRLHTACPKVAEPAWETGCPEPSESLGQGPCSGPGWAKRALGNLRLTWPQGPAQHQARAPITGGCKGKKPTQVLTTVQHCCRRGGTPHSLGTQRAPATQTSGHAGGGRTKVQAARSVEAALRRQRPLLMETRVPSLPLLFSRQKLFYVLLKNFWLMRYFSIKMAQWNAPHLGSSKCPKLASSLRLILDKPESGPRNHFKERKLKGTGRSTHQVDPPGTLKDLGRRVSCQVGEERM